MTTLILWGNPMLTVCEHPSQTVCAKGTEMCFMPVKEAVQVSNIECLLTNCPEEATNWNVYE